MKKELEPTVTELDYEFILTPFEERIYKLAESSIPTRMDRTNEGEFLIQSYYPSLQRTGNGLEVDHKPIKVDYDKAGNPVFKDKDARKALGYFLNEDCEFSLRTHNNKVQTYFYGDADNEYHFKTNLKESMSDEEIRMELIKGFSDKFGWIELFEEDSHKLKDIDVKFWVAFYYNDKRKLIEVSRDFFEQNNKSEEECESNNELTFEDEDSAEYDKLCEMSVEVASKHFKGLNKNEVWAEFLQPSDRDIKDCAILSVSIN